MEASDSAKLPRVAETRGSECTSGRRSVRRAAERNESAGDICARETRSANRVGRDEAGAGITTRRGDAFYREWAAQPTQRNCIAAGMQRNSPRTARVGAGSRPHLPIRARLGSTYYFL